MIDIHVPTGLIDVVLDTDTYNEVDDQFALAYMFCSQDRCNIKAVYAAPFVNYRADTAKKGMEASYAEILKLLSLMGNESFAKNVFKGSESLLKTAQEPVISDAANDLATRAMAYTSEKPLYVVAIAALTNIASALLINPEIANRIVLIWLGGNMPTMDEPKEFNLSVDKLAAKVVFDKMQNRLVQVPCLGCVSAFTTTEYELKAWLSGKNELCDYLVDSVMKYHDWAKGKVWSKPIWDVTAVAWLLNDGQRFMRDRYERVPSITADGYYANDAKRGYMKFVYYIERDALYADLFEKLSNADNFAYRARD